MFRATPRRAATVALCLGGASVALAGCGGGGKKQTSGGASHGSGAKHYSVVFIPGATGVAFYETMGAGIKAEAQKLGMSYSTQGAADFAPAAQTPVVSAVCSRGPSLLLVAPTDPSAMRPAIARCMSEGVKVVLVDTGLANASGVVSSVTSNNIQGGEAAGRVIGKALHGRGQVALMSLSATATTQVQRLQGAKRELKRAYPGISIVSTQYTQQAPTSSETTARSLLSAHPGIGAFFGAAEPNAEGVAQALVATGKKAINVGYDASPPEVSLLKKGQISALVIQQPAKEGALGVEYGYDALTGHSSRIRKRVELPNVVVSAAQADSATARKYYYTSTG
ncbi:MAG TPA: substrate-binding domain-containing protein [Solirubrobacteraceae bacterium]|nr:substrate-binding domain-containing protein [Solirubrobacteraceae bacterium]